jgi:hypothetical protein
MITFVLAASGRGQQIVAVLPGLIESRQYRHLLHDNRAKPLKALLMLKGDLRIVVVSVPLYLLVYF